MDAMVNKKHVAIIPARGGSKRIPKKNILDLAGKPMIAYTIEAALESQMFEDVIVSTDSPEIAEIAEKCGASVPFLRTQYSDDFVSVSTVTKFVLEQLQEINKSYDIVTQLMPNCPLRGSNQIIEALTNFIDNNHNFQISCFKYGWMNPWWAHEMLENGAAKPVFPDDMRNRRSQDQPDLYCPTGAIWIADVQSFMQQGTFYGNDYRFFPMDWKYAVDIDDYEDLEMAAYFLNHAN
jgi:CMP-N-acetylneuraminic acid synthetase